MKELLADILLVIKASGATKAHVRTEGLDVLVEYPVEGPESLDPSVSSEPPRPIQRPKFRVD